MNKLTGSIRRNKVTFALISVALIIFIIMIIYRIFFYSDSKTLYMTKAQVAKAVALANHTEDELLEYDNYYSSKLADKWYVNYMNYMYAIGAYNVEKFKAKDSVANGYYTYSNLIDLIDVLNINDDTIDSLIKKHGKRDKVSFDVFAEIYPTICDNLFGANVSIKSITVAATNETLSDISNNTILTTSGVYNITGYDFNTYVDSSVTVACVGKEILCVMRVDTTDVTYENLWVTSSADTLSTYFYGYTRDFLCNLDLNNLSNAVCDVTVSNGTVKTVTVKDNYINGKVLAVTDSYIDISGYGKLTLSDSAMVYKIYGGVSLLDTSDIIVGYDNENFVIDDEGNICAALIDRSITANTIRVLIYNSDYEDMYHDSVIISSTSGMTMSYGDKSISLSKSEVVVLEKNSVFFEYGRVTFTPVGNGEIVLDSVTRSLGTPSYAGTIEVDLSDDGIIVVNETSLEKYLCRVVASEMPSSYPLEALKAQAVCARTYAYSAIFDNKLCKYGAHVDDSTNYQVYNNQTPSENQLTAVKSTSGEIITYLDTAITAFYFSTSCGVTTDGGIWNMDEGYLTGLIIPAAYRTLDLTDEDTFYTFITDNPSGYESECAYYRWNFYLDTGSLSDIVNNNLSVLYKNYKNYVLMLENGSYVSKNISNVGIVKEIKVLERGTNGVVTAIEIIGTDATVKISRQITIRSLFDLNGISVNLNNDTTTDTLSLLPSAFFALKKDVSAGGDLKGYYFYGGGMGHGCGLSQNGAKDMAEIGGYTYDEIIKMYYNNVELSSVY